MSRETGQPTLARVRRWMQDTMSLRDQTDVAAAPSGLRCDLHGVGHSSGALKARLGGALLVRASLFTLMVGARPAEAREPGNTSPMTASVGAGLGALGLGSFVLGGSIERRTRYHVWLQTESRAITRADVGALVATGEAARGRLDAAWRPDQLWLVGAGADDEVAGLARASGVRCFVMQGGDVREL